jgi:hypothetical protein
MYLTKVRKIKKNMFESIDFKRKDQALLIRE